MTAASMLGVCATASANTIFMPTLQQVINRQQADNQAAGHALQPPAPPCPESGQLPSPFSNCGAPEFPATSLPVMGNMSYWGGHVQVHPKVYLVYFGWGRPGAFPANKPCQAEPITEGSISATLGCDPDGAGKRMADWVYQMGGTGWAGVQTQYYETRTDAAGQTYQQHISNDRNLLAGIWTDDVNPTSRKISYTDMAREAERAVQHFGISKANLINSDIVIAQPQNFSDPIASSSGYCAFHDYTEPGLEGGIYNGITPGIVYTNMPYILAINSGNVNLCGVHAVNSGPKGKLDGISIVLGHEIEESITDPGAEDVLGTGASARPIGGWFDPTDANENGDKCAWVGQDLAAGIGPAPNVVPIPGAMGDIVGNAGTTFAVQSLWSNDAAEGAGYCAGAGTDLPQPVPPA